MTEIELPSTMSVQQALYVLEQISPRRYMLHHMAGGNGWCLQFNYGLKVKIKDPQMATWALLKLKR